VDWTDLIAAPRWTPLVDFVARYYASPLRPEDGNTDEEIQQAESRLGTALPAALRGWYRLVGRRLGGIQDYPHPLDRLKLRDDGLIPVWVENQEVWTLSAALEPDDPDVVVEGDFFEPPDETAGPLSKILLAMLAGDTLVGAWSGTGKGTLGPLGERVLGGNLKIDETSALQARYVAVPWPAFPGYPPFLGDNTTLIRAARSRAGSRVEWITADDAAYERLSLVLPIGLEGGVRELVVAFHGLTRGEMRCFERGTRIDVERFQRALRAVGHVGMAWCHPAEGAVRLHVTTTEPQRAWEIIRQQVDSSLLSRVTVAHRPKAVARFEVIFPSHIRRFVLPD
jgi:hypothetical protein